MLERTVSAAAFTNQDAGQQHVLHRDFESRSPLDFPTVGAHRYAADPNTEIQIVGYAVHGGPVLQWFLGTGDPVPPRVALERWVAHIVELVAGKQADAVPIRGRR